MHGTVGAPLVLATGENYADAMVAGPLAGRLDGSLLMTLPDRLPESVRAEIERLRPSEIIVLGSESSVSEAAVRTASEAAGTEKVTRIAGSDRVDTAAKVAEQYFPYARQAFVATGWNFPDALSAASLGAITDSPVLLTTPDRAHPRVRDYLQRNGVLTRAVVWGDERSVSARAVTQIEVSTTAVVERVAGADRYETNVAGVQKFAPNAEGIVVATGSTHPDALTAALVSARTGYPLVIVPGECSTATTGDLVTQLQPKQAIVIGSEQSVSDGALSTRC